MGRTSEFRCFFEEDLCLSEEDFRLFDVDVAWSAEGLSLTQIKKL